MKKILCFVLAAVLLLSLTSCQVKRTKLYAGTTKGVTSLDPATASSQADLMYLHNCYESLLRIDDEGNIDLSGALSYKISDDMLTYTFKLNPKAKYYISEDVKTTLTSLGMADFDGRVTADDFVCGFRRCIEKNMVFKSIKGVKKYYAGDGKLENVAVKAVDDETLEITLAEADCDFLYEIALSKVVPCNEKFCNELDSIYATNPATVLCNGPYYLSGFAGTGTLTMTRNDSYEGRYNTLNSMVTIYETGKSESVKSRFEDGAYDIFQTTSAERLDEGSQPVSENITAVWGIMFKGAGEFTSNANLRKAIANSFDISLIKLPSFAYKKTDSVVPESFIVSAERYSSFTHSHPSVSKNEQKAKSYFEDALDELEAEEITLLVTVPEEIKKNFETVCDKIEHVFGGKLTLKVSGYESGEESTVLSNGGFDMAILPQYAETGTAYSFLSSFTEAPCSCTDKSYKKILKSFVGATAESDKAASVSDAEEYIINEAYFIPVFTTADLLYLASETSGIYSPAHNVIYFNSGTKG